MGSCTSLSNWKVGDDVAPEWVVQLFEQADEQRNGYVEQAELCEFLQFINPAVKDETLQASFAIVGNARRLDLEEFHLWVKHNRPIIDPLFDEVIAEEAQNPAGGSRRGAEATDPLAGTQGESADPEGQAGGAAGGPSPNKLGAIGRMLLDLPCNSITENVLTHHDTNDRLGEPGGVLDPMEAQALIASLTSQVQVLQTQLGQTLDEYT